MKITSALFLLLISFLLFSCYHNQELVINKDMSGEITYDLAVSDDFFTFIDHINGDETSIDLNLSNFDNARFFQKELSDNKITIEKYRAKSENQKKEYTLSLGFEQLNLLPELFTNKYIKNTIYRKRNIIYVRTLITLDFLTANQDKQKEIKRLFSGINGDEKKYLESFASSIILTFRYKGFSEIIKNETAKTGTISEDKKEIYFEYTLLEILQSSEPIEIRIGYRRSVF